MTLTTLMTSNQADLDRCPACNRLVEWRCTVTGTRLPVDAAVLIRHGVSGKDQVLNRYGVVIHSAKVVKEDGESAWLLHVCLTTGKLNPYRSGG